MMQPSDSAALPNHQAQHPSAPPAPHAYSSFLQANKLRDDASAETLYQVYHDLQRIRQWTNLRISHLASRPYIAGSAAVAFDSVFGHLHGAQRAQRTQAVVPVRADEWLSPAQLHRLCAQCVHPDTRERLPCVTLAIVDEDSTTAYYRVLNRWEDIVDARWKVKKVSVEEGGGTHERERDERVGESEHSLSASDTDA